MEPASNIKTNTKLTYIALIFICCYSLIFTDYWRFWNDDQTPFNVDTAISYWYVPAAFIHADFTQLQPKNKHVFRDPSGKMIPKYSYGMALMYTPWFAVGHAIAFMKNAPMDGYSLPYCKAVHYGCVIYVLLGLFVLSRILRRYFSDMIVAITLIILFFGTNLMLYALLESERTHGSLFLMISLFLWYCIKWHEKPNIRNSIMIGLTLGIITIIRPTDLVVGSLFILLGIVNAGDIKERFKLFIEKKWLLIVMFFSFALVLLPQLIYWKIYTGNFYYYSYVREGFFWAQPKMFSMLFSYRNGWFIYTPVMLFACIGLYFFFKDHKYFRVAVLTYLLVNLYILSCWWCWWYIGFGMRALVQSYPVMALGLAAFIQMVQKNELSEKLKLKYAVILLFSFFICLNLVQSYQSKIWVLNADGMNRKTYWASFCKLSWTQEEWDNYRTKFSSPDVEKAIKGKR